MLINKKGYSLIEISIVLTIIAFIIAGTIGGKSLLDSSKINLLYSETSTLKLAIKSYMEDNGITSLYSTNSIKIETLIKEGYLKKKGSITDCYPSKLAGCWYTSIETINNDSNIYYPKLTLASINNIKDPTIDTLLCNKFANRFSNGNSDGFSDNCVKKDDNGICTCVELDNNSNNCVREANETYYNVQRNLSINEDNSIGIICSQYDSSGNKLNNDKKTTIEIFILDTDE